ncbi:MAG TPA: diacylglycerol kinase family protein [Bacteroidota bacterium]|nr:diacylglycerol kinase family protein [Bacteroidota bacterium]
MKWVSVIVNPASGRNGVGRQVVPLSRLLERESIAHDLYVTRSPLHASEIASRLPNDGRIVLGVGGDGTAHELAQGIAGTRNLLALLSMGSGNDFGRMLRSPNTLGGLPQYLEKGKKQSFDVVELMLRRPRGRKFRRMMINTLGIGFDAEVSHYSRRIKSLKGLLLYAVSTFCVLPRYKPCSYTLEVSGRSITKSYYLICLANGQFEGGGFRIAPEANPRDGYVDICTVDPLGLARALTLFPRVITGTHVSEPEVEFQRARKMCISSENPFTVHIDGEIETGIMRLEATVKRETLNVLVGDSSVR